MAGFSPRSTSLELVPHADDAAESQMAGRSIDRLGHTCRRAVAPAVIRSAQVGAALHHLTGNLDLWRAGVIALLAVSPLGLWLAQHDCSTWW